MHALAKIMHWDSQVVTMEEVVIRKNCEKGLEMFKDLSLT